MSKHGALAIFVVNPCSEAIARKLTNGRATACEHRRNPCIIRCGVRSRAMGVWEVIPNRVRRQSMAKIVDCAAKDGICDTFTVNDSKRLHGWDVQEP